MVLNAREKHETKGRKWNSGVGVQFYDQKRPEQVMFA